MNINKQVFWVILATGLMVTGIVYADDPLKTQSSVTTSGSSTGLGWQEGAMRRQVLVSDGLRISAGPGFSTSGFTVSLSFSSNYDIVDCCKPATVKESWCNFNADDERCDN